jgi:hypothetical protein
MCPASQEKRMAGGTGSARVRRIWALTVALGALTGALLSAPAQAADPCDGFSWNVSHEHALFATPSAAVTAEAGAGAAPTLSVDKLYDIALTPQDEVHFVLAPEKKTLADGAYGGMVTLHIPVAGKYRVSMSEGFWIDLIAQGRFVPTDDFTGSHTCHAPRKIVQFILPAGDLTLQFANANSASVQVTVTAVSQ